MITVGRNQNQIFGNIDGVKFSNLPLDVDLFETLKSAAKATNTITTPKEYKVAVDNFKILIAPATAIIEKEKQEKKESGATKPVKLGTQQLSLVMNPEVTGKELYLFNGKAYSRFYVPQPIVDLIRESESKGMDATPYYKLVTRALRGQVMTQEKFDRLANYISKPWIDSEEQQLLLAKGVSKEQAIKLTTGRQVGITLEGLLNTYKVSVLVREEAQILDETPIQPEIQEPKIEIKSEALETEVVETPKTFDQIVKEVKESKELANFVYTPIRNGKGHFLARGTDAYIAEFNRQLQQFKVDNRIIGDVTTTINKIEGASTYNQKVVGQKAIAREKSAEDFIYEPAYQRKSGDAFYCGNSLGHEIRVGKIHKLAKWSQVNTNDHNSAVPGLHVGGLDYIRGYTGVIHNIFVDPQYVGAVVSVENGDGAMRVKEYYVHSSIGDKPNRGQYNSSLYAAMTDKQWDAQLVEALITVKEAEVKIEQILKEAEAAQSIVDNTF